MWRVRVGGECLYVYILLEFQSGVDRWMALRMQVYLGLLYQDLVKRHDLEVEDLLPPVLPLVFYNGAAPWTARSDLADLIAPAPDGLAALQAKQRYFLIDQQRLDPEVLRMNRSVLAQLFRLELLNDGRVVADALSALVTWIEDDAQSPLRRSVQAWAEQLMQRRSRSGFAFESVIALEGNTMDINKFEFWEDAWIEEGRQEGMQKGPEQGLEQGAAALRSVLERLLTKRFEALPVGASATIAQAPLDQLTESIERVIEVDSPEALFASAPPPAPRSRDSASLN